MKDLEQLKKEAREEMNGCSFLREEGAAEHISQIVQHYIDKATSATLRGGFELYRLRNRIQRPNRL